MSSLETAFAPDRLRLFIIGGAGRAAAIEAELSAGGLAGPVAVVGEAGRVTPAALASAAAADVAIVVSSAGSGFSAETRRECLLAWGLGAMPVMAIECAGPRDVAAARAAGEAFTAWAHGLGGPALEWVELRPGAERLAAVLRRYRDWMRAAAPLRLWIEAAGVDADGPFAVGWLAAGRVEPGKPVVALPGAATVSIVSLEPQPAGSPAEPARVKLRLDRPLGLEAGAMLVAAEQRPELADQVAAHIVWSSEQPLLPGRPYQLRLGPQVVTAQVGALKHKLNPSDLHPIAARLLSHGELGLANLSFSAPLLFDPFERCPNVGRFSLFETAGGAPVGHGRIAFALRRATNIHWQALSVDKAARARLKGQRPCCLWLTGLSGSGKSTVASLLEQRLNGAGRHTYTLDGDNVRHGLNRDLGFTDADRVENIRRVAEVARLFVDAGLIVIVSFISPFRAERDMARDRVGEGEFLEIFVDTPIEICEQRDPKGLYRKARAGQLKNFTGIDSPYEPPERPEIHLRGGTASPEALVDQVCRELERRGILAGRAP